MENYKKLLRLNIEIEGLLRVLNAHTQPMALKMLSDKFEEFSCEMYAMLSEHSHEISVDSTGDENTGASIAAAVSPEEEPQQPEKESSDMQPEPVEDQQEEESDLDEMLRKVEEVVKKNKEEAEEEKRAAGESEVNDAFREMREEDTTNCRVPVTGMAPVAEMIEEERTEETEEEVPHTIESEHRESIDEMISRRTARDLNKAFTLNDKYRFTRELFNGNNALFNSTISIASEMDSFADVIEMVLPRISSADDQVRKEFLDIIGRHFGNK